MTGKPTVCLTGGIGSGKSSVARLFAARGVEVIDADALAHELTAPGGAAMAAIRAAFVAGVIDERGALDRERVRRQVFGDPAARQRLEAILHPMIRAESERRRAAATSAYLILMIPLLVDSGDPRRRENVAFGDLSLGDARQGFGGHPDRTPRDGWRPSPRRDRSRGAGL